MREGREIKTLGDACDKASSNVSQNQLEHNNGPYPIFGASGFIKNVSFYHQDKPYLSIVKDGSGVGRVTKMEAYTSVIGTLQYLLPKDGIDLDYLNYSLMSVDFKKYVVGAAIPHIYFKDYKKEPFLWMALNRQKVIVSILLKAFSALAKAKANAEQNLKNAKELFKSYLRISFCEIKKKYPERRLGELCETSAGGTPLKSKMEFYLEGRIPWLRSGEVDKKEITESELRITIEGLKNSSAKLFPENTVLVAMYGATAGQVGILKFESSTNQAICGILPSKNFNPEFLYYRFLSGKQELIKQAVGGAQPNISQIKIRNSLVPILSISEQNKIGLNLNNYLTATEKMGGIYQQKINNLEELKKSILQKAFSGELTSKSSTA